MFSLGRLPFVSGAVSSVTLERRKLTGQFPSRIEMVPKLSAPAKEQRRTALLDAAWRCIARTGYRNVTVDAVCAEAGLSKGAFYTYFDQKHDLLLALMDDDAAGLNDVVADAEGQPSGVGQIRRFAAGL